MLRKLPLIAVSLILAVFAVDSVYSFSLMVAPAKKVFEMRRGGEVSFDVKFTDFSSDGVYDIVPENFIYDENGSRQMVPTEDIANPELSLSNWIEVSERLEVQKSQEEIIPLTIRVPENAPFGDHYATVYFRKRTDAEDGSSSGGANLNVSGSVGTVMVVKVLGGTAEKVGSFEGFEIQTREKARNTADFVYTYKNEGNTFFSVQGIVEVYGSRAKHKDGAEPLKVLRKKAMVFPNVTKKVTIPLGDLGDNFSEKNYFAVFRIYEMDGSELGELIAEEEKEFYYYVPAGKDAEVTVLEKEVLVQAPVSEYVKELAIYIGGFLIVIIILIKVLFFSQKKD